MATHEDKGAGASRPDGSSRATDIGGLGIALGLFVFAALIAWDASSYPERRSYAQIGPEIFPYIVGAGIAIFGVLTIVMARRGDFPEREALNFAPVLWLLAALGGMTALLYAGSGFIIASSVLFGLAARGFGRKPVWLTFLVGLLLNCMLYVLFRQGLGLSLPGGLIEPYINVLFR
ncbi:tripartite tricarboxylate transporter TctB family protein [Pararhizobium haloflavum]|uniref:tripartite tricarboxylate transporter TctB family protein n=1 Tax=Pararhizobium haloflavum TaxID=2037914 RepID=UPI000C18170E|nr:tripartite tricarboxylate transporter TctB family protein [Pararhizobium haloflavum]